MPDDAPRAGVRRTSLASGPRQLRVLEFGRGVAAERRGPPPEGPAGLPVGPAHTCDAGAESAVLVSAGWWRSVASPKAAAARRRPVATVRAVL